MAGKQKGSRKSRASGALRTAKVACGAAAEHGPVELLEKARKFRRPRGIHTRRVIPKVRRGAAAPDASPSAAMAIDRPTPSRAAARRRTGRRAAVYLEAWPRLCCLRRRAGSVVMPA